MSKKLLVRFATVADLPRVARIAQVTWDTTYSNVISFKNRQEFLERAYKPENLALAVDAEGHWFYVVEVNGTVVGFSHFIRLYHPTRTRAELVRLYVLPDYQNQGIGRTLLSAGLAALAEARIGECAVSVQSSNKRARKFYEQHGFVFRRTHGQFLGSQIITLVEYIRRIGEGDLIYEPNP